MLMKLPINNKPSPEIVAKNLDEDLFTIENIKYDKIIQKMKFGKMLIQYRLIF